MANLQFVMKKTEDLIPYARNARTHSTEQVAKLAGSIKEFGFINPIIISKDGGILAGHGRVMAARKLGLAEVPCIKEDHLTDAQRRAYILADNRLALDAGWDEDMLRIELDELRDLDFDISLIGFSDDELDEIRKANETQVGDGDEEEDGEVSVDETEHPVTGTPTRWSRVPPHVDVANGHVYHHTSTLRTVTRTPTRDPRVPPRVKGHR